MTGTSLEKITLKLMYQVFCAAVENIYTEQLKYQVELVEGLWNIVYTGFFRTKDAKNGLPWKYLLVERSKHHP